MMHLKIYDCRYNQFSGSPTFLRGVSESLHVSPKFCVRYEQNWSKKYPQRVLRDCESCENQRSEMSKDSPLLGVTHFCNFIWKDELYLGVQ